MKTYKVPTLKEMFWTYANFNCNLANLHYLSFFFSYLIATPTD